MKRFWFGITLLLVLLAGGIVSSICLDRLHTPISHELSLAAEAALGEQWEDAVRLAHQAKSQWQKQRHAVAAITSHSPMEQIDSLFDELEIYQAAGEVLPFASCCAALSALILAMAEAQTMNWWNLL